MKAYRRAKVELIPTGTPVHTGDHLDLLDGTPCRTRKLPAKETHRPWSPLGGALTKRPFVGPSWARANPIHMRGQEPLIRRGDSEPEAKANPRKGRDEFKPPYTTSRASRVDEMWRIAPAGDRALLVTIGRVIDPALLGQVIALDQGLQEHRPPGLPSTVPAYASLLCRFDPGVTDVARLADAIRQFEGREEASIPSTPVVNIPTRYDGPDLPEVALKTNLTPAGPRGWRSLSGMRMSGTDRPMTAAPIGGPSPDLCRPPRMTHPASGPSRQPSAGSTPRHAVGRLTLWDSTRSVGSRNRSSTCLDPTRPASPKPPRKRFPNCAAPSFAEHFQRPPRP